MTFFSNSPVTFRGPSYVTATRNTSKDPDVGYVAIADNVEYIFAYNGGNSEIYPGYSVVPQSGMTAMTVTLSSVTNSGKTIGTVKHATIPTASYGWLVRRGVTPVEMNPTSGSVASNGDIGIGVNGVATPVTISTGIFSKPFGQALAAIVSSASGSAYVSHY